MDSENYFETFHRYAHYKELLEAINEIRDHSEPYEHNEMWEAFQWQKRDIEQIEKLDRAQEIEQILNCSH